MPSSPRYCSWPRPALAHQHVVLTVRCRHHLHLQERARLQSRLDAITAEKRDREVESDVRTVLRCLGVHVDTYTVMPRSVHCTRCKAPSKSPRIRSRNSKPPTRSRLSSIATHCGYGVVPRTRWRRWCRLLTRCVARHTTERARQVWTGTGGAYGRPESVGGAQRGFGGAADTRIVPTRGADRVPPGPRQQAAVRGG